MSGRIIESCNPIASNSTPSRMSPPSTAKEAISRAMEDFLLHFSIRQYLRRPGERYHVTDVSKGAMLGKSAPGLRGRNDTTGGTPSS
jgi:hypothetical protein